MADCDFYLKKPLPAGDAIRYWQISATATERFDVPDVPMEGEMDPFFFLTRHKNFIPHEYPCRRLFAEQHRGQRPKVAGSFRHAQHWLPFGSDRPDLSTFYFRPTRLATWARTCIDAETEGTARVRLGTCGGAVLWVNGDEAGWLAPYSRNLEARAELSLPLRAGINEIVVFFDDLAERDIRYFFQLDYLSGPSAKVALPIPVEAAVANNIACALEGSRLDKATYLSGDVTCVFGQALAHDVEATVTVMGDFISASRREYAFALKAGTDRVTIGPSEEMPAGFRNFRITLNADGFRTTRILGAEICHAARQAHTSASLPARIEEALNEVAEFAERDAVCAFARLASGKAGTEADAIINGILPSIEDCHDCADFSIVPLIWARTAWGDDISAGTRARLDRAILGFRFWMDEPGNDVQWYFSENHALLFHTAAYLAGHLFRKSVFVRSGRSGAEQSAVGAARVRAWLDHFEECEMAEFNSAPYFPIDLKGLTALAALSPDADIAERARKGIVRLCEIIARSAHHGILTAAQGRSYEYTLCAGRSLELSGIARMLWGRGWFGAHMQALPQLAVCLRDHGLAIPDTLSEIACLGGDSHLEWRFAQGPNRIARIYHYKSRHFSMGSAAHYRWGEWGYQETVFHLRLGKHPEAALWINHPGEPIQFGYGRPSFWGGCGTLPRVHQYRGLAILDFSVSEEHVGYTHAWFPAAEFDESKVTETLALARSDRGCLLLRGSAPLCCVTDGPSAGCELRQHGRKTRWIARVCESASLQDVAAKFASLSASEQDDGSLTVVDPEYGSVIFGVDGSVRAEGRVILAETFTVAGEVREFAAM
ncbi:hypothetical protein ACDA63_08815 [Uliginosibacterium sp. sgz301328]|uniref:hypothetical protein n=1 Tax=Uliginosibacterium sp. sgz301328 TaxID=3243764 RepID=UPI00359E9EE2